MTLLSQAQLATSADFISRVTQAAITSAKDVMAEAANVNGHELRVQLAQQILRSSQVFGSLIAQGVVTNVAITALSTDSDIQFTVNSLFNAYAGVSL